MPDVLSERIVKSSPGRFSVVPLGLVLLITFLLFYPSLFSDFLNYDDPGHISNNSAVKSLKASHILKTFQGGMINKTYIPLTTFSFSVEYFLFRLNPFFYHLDNLILHLGVIALVYFFAYRCGLSPWTAALAATIFGIHPMHVESVAWVTERKDVLYSLFYLLAVLFYLGHWEKQRKGKYALAVFFGFLSILAKPMALSLPLILLLCDWLRGRSWSKSMVWDKIPFCFYIIPIAWKTFSENTDTMGAHTDKVSAGLIYLWTFLFYLQKFFVPSPLHLFYVPPEPISLLNPYYLCLVIAFGGIAALVYFFRRNRWLVFALLFYYLSIFFLLRFNILIESDIVADRFMYLPSMGICLFLAVSWENFYKKISFSKIQRNLSRVFLIVLIAALGVKTYQQCQNWKNTETLTTHILRYVPNNSKARLNRGNAHLDKGDLFSAVDDYQFVINQRPQDVAAYSNLGVVYQKRGEYDKALKMYTAALVIDQNDPALYNNRGVIYAKLKEIDSALQDFNKAIELDPMNSLAYMNRGGIYYELNQYDLALRDYDQLLAFDPYDAISYLRKAVIYKKINNPQAVRDTFVAAGKYNIYLEKPYNAYLQAEQNREGR